MSKPTVFYTWWFAHDFPSRPLKSLEDHLFEEDEENPNITFELLHSLSNEEFNLAMRICGIDAEYKNALENYLSKVRLQLVQHKIFTFEFVICEISCWSDVQQKKMQISKTDKSC